MYHEPVSFPASLPPSQGKLLHDLILQHTPSIVVEIGCFIGVSSVWIGSALKKVGGGRLFSLDLFFQKARLNQIIPVPFATR
jgi:predicted O-methyltransferase YrrM